MSAKSRKRHQEGDGRPLRPSGRRPAIPSGFPMKSRLSRREKERGRKRREKDVEDEEARPE